MDEAEDIFTRLKQDHDKHRKLLSRLLDPSGAMEERETLRIIARLGVNHWELFRRSSTARDGSVCTVTGAQTENGTEIGTRTFAPKRSADVSMP